MDRLSSLLREAAHSDLSDQAKETKSLQELFVDSEEKIVSMQKTLRDAAKLRGDAKEEADDE